MPKLLPSLALLVAASCAAAPVGPGGNGAAPALRAPSALGAPVPSASPAVSPPPEPIVVVAEPTVVAGLDRAGFDAGSTILGTPAQSTRALGASPAFRSIVQVIARDLADDRARDPVAGVGMSFPHRQFDVRWLDSDRTRFELVGVVNRLDRRPFAPAHCGEVRFVYRLAYDVAIGGTDLRSRLPMTVNVVFFQEPDASGSCAAAARSWLRPPGVRERGAEEAFLTSGAGPLSAARRATFRPKSVEVNFQSVRYPSTVRPNMAGHAEYVLRVFHRADGASAFVEAPLENTPDVARLARDPALQRALVQALRDPSMLAAVDAGTPVLPERFLARRAVSVSPHGLARLGNRRFSAALPRNAFDGLDLSTYDTLRTSAGLLRRLDALTCPGCHQSRSIAGFHFLGVEAEEDRVDALEVPMSPHFHAELERRRPYVVALAEGRAPEERRASPERAAGDDGLGARCGLGDPAFSPWRCHDGLACVGHFDAEVGECEPSAGPGIGDACESGPVSASVDPRKDAVRLGEKLACAGGGVCEENAVGFPGGLCSAGCESLPPGAVCGGIALLAEFNACLGAGTPFERCVAEHTRPAALRACGFHAPCRDDYVCVRGEHGGACIPPYFTFQLRVDGHPI